MVQERELLAAAVALAILLIMWWNRSSLRELPRWRLLIGSFSLLAASLVCSVA